MSSDITKTLIDILTYVQEVLAPGVQQAERTRMSQVITRFIELVGSEPEGDDEAGEPPQDAAEEQV